jgi:hypothetical protein
MGGVWKDFEECIRETLIVFQQTILRILDIEGKVIEVKKRDKEYIIGTYRKTSLPHITPQTFQTPLPALKF